MQCTEQFPSLSGGGLGWGWGVTGPNWNCASRKYLFQHEAHRKYVMPKPHLYQEYFYSLCPAPRLMGHDEFEKGGLRGISRGPKSPLAPLLLKGGIICWGMYR